MFRLLLGFLLLLALPVFAGEENTGKICDRNGVVLAKIDYSVEPAQWEFPFGSLAIHVLEGLDKAVLPGPAQKLALTIDARIQTIVEEEMWEVGRGAAVVVDPANGRILAMASVPSYDPRDPKEEIAPDPTVPLLNRAVSSFAPGATFLSVTALAGASVGLQDKKFSCEGGVKFGAKFMKCYIFGKGGHGEMNFDEAIKLSCGAFFYQYGNAAGAEAIAKMGRMLGLGAKTGVLLQQENAGILPSPQWLKENYPRETWSNGYTANTSIGQGFVLSTPLQMALVSATIANGGYSYYPRLIDHMADGTKVQPLLRTNLLQNGVTPEVMRRVQEALLGRFKILRRNRPENDLVIAGCRGTAQSWRPNGQKDNHSWQVCFAPFDKPRMTISLLVQNSKNNSIANKVLERALADRLPEPTPQEAHRGHFDQVPMDDDSPR